MIEGLDFSAHMGDALRRLSPAKRDRIETAVRTAFAEPQAVDLYEPFVLTGIAMHLIVLNDVLVVLADLPRRKLRLLFVALFRSAGEIETFH